MLWALQEGDGLLLLEEPELSLNDGVVSSVPLLIDRVLRERRKGTNARQVLVSTHSETLLQNVAGDAETLLIEPGQNGSTVRPRNAEEDAQIAHGMTPAEVLLPKTRPQHLLQAELW